MAYYPSSCELVETHSADCFEDREFGRIRSAGFIRSDYSFDPASAQAWRTGIDLGRIIMIPQTNGESPKAAPRMGPAYGLHGEVLLGYDFTASYDDPNFNSNCAFYNSIVGNLNYTFFYRTSSHVYITHAPATIIPNRNVQNDLTGEVVWSVDVKWISREFACGVPAPDGVFDPDCCPPAYTGYSTGETGTTDPCATYATAMESISTQTHSAMTNMESVGCKGTLATLLNLRYQVMNYSIPEGCSGATGTHNRVLGSIQNYIDHLPNPCY